MNPIIEITHALSLPLFAEWKSWHCGAFSVSLEENVNSHIIGTPICHLCDYSSKSCVHCVINRLVDLALISLAITFFSHRNKTCVFAFSTECMCVLGCLYLSKGYQFRCVESAWTVGLLMLTISYRCLVFSEFITSYDLHSDRMKPASKTDQGWAWVVLAASLGSSLLNGTLCYFVGVVHAGLLKKYNESVAMTAWAGGIYSSLMSLGG